MAELKETQTRNNTLSICARCGDICRSAKSQNPDARVFKHAEKGLCANCVVTQFLLSVETLRLGIEKNGINVLLNPMIQKQFESVMYSGGSEMLPDEINWNLIVRRWKDPFPKGYEPERTVV